MSGLTTLMTIMALIPLFSVVLMLHGKRRPAAESQRLLPNCRLLRSSRGAGFGNAIVGTLVMVGLAALISVPFGVLGAVFLAEVGPRDQVWPKWFACPPKS